MPTPKTPAKSQKAIFLFYGADRYSSYQKLKFWQDEFIKKHGESSMEVLEGKNLDFKDFATNIGSLPFLSEKRLIIIRDFLENGKKDELKAVAENLDNAGDFCVIVFHENETPEKSNPLFKKIAKIGKLEEFPGMTTENICRWIMDKAKREGIKISFSTANYLSQYCDPDLWSISSELEKLTLFANGQEITREMIDDLCLASLTSSVFKLTDNIAQKNRKQSLKNFAILKDSGEELGKIFFMIVRHFRILIQVKELLNKGEKSFEITKKLKEHPFVIQKTSSQSRNFTLEKLEDIYKKLLEIDIQVKTGKIKSHKGDSGQFELAVEKFIIQCSRG